MRMRCIHGCMLVVKLSGESPKPKAEKGIRWKALLLLSFTLSGKQKALVSAELGAHANTVVCLCTCEL